MNIKNLFQDDNAVSPVIGVILMVAITVILAAVIASFVLGLGSSSDEVQPNSSFEFDYEAGGPDTLSITLTDGDAILVDELYIRGDLDASVSGETNSDFTSLGGSSEVGGVNSIGGATLSSGNELTSGQGVELEATGSGSFAEHDVSIVWETAEDSATLETSEGPDA